MDDSLHLKVQTDCSKKIKDVGRQVIAGSVLATVVMCISVPNLGTEGELGYFAHGITPLLLCMAAWGLATGIGLLRAWRWARISMLVFGGLLAALCALLAVPFLLMPGGGVVWWEAIVMRAVGVLFFLMPAAIVVRWYIYFRRDNVRAYFQTSRKAPTAPA